MTITPKITEVEVVTKVKETSFLLELSAEQLLVLSILTGDLSFTEYKMTDIYYQISDLLESVNIDTLCNVLGVIDYTTSIRNNAIEVQLIKPAFEEAAAALKKLAC